VAGGDAASRRSRSASRAERTNSNAPVKRLIERRHELLKQAPTRRCRSATSARLQPAVKHASTTQETSIPRTRNLQLLLGLRCQRSGPASPAGIDDGPERPTSAAQATQAGQRQTPRERRRRFNTIGINIATRTLATMQSTVPPATASTTQNNSQTHAGSSRLLGTPAAVANKRSGTASWQFRDVGINAICRPAQTERGQRHVPVKSPAHDHERNQQAPADLTNGATSGPVSTAGRTTRPTAITQDAGSSICPIGWVDGQHQQSFAGSLTGQNNSSSADSEQTAVNVQRSPVKSPRFDHERAHSADQERERRNQLPRQQTTPAHPVHQPTHDGGSSSARLGRRGVQWSFAAVRQGSLTEQEGLVCRCRTEPRLKRQRPRYIAGGSITAEHTTTAPIRIDERRHQWLSSNTSHHYP